ncbi:MAG: tail fiber domain-containing protein [Crocinitomicaceae bacterium]|nr:tail fiber domain-containing protein [Flavobacteriales bacterium]NQZ34875.1 tail fiber domain-containing protein [Crocinitomicaceae bacterium]
MSKKLKIKANVEVNGNLNLDAKNSENKLTIGTGPRKIGLLHKNESIQMATYLSDAEKGASIGTLGAHKFSIFTGGTGEYKLTVDKGGNVGIGTNSPSEKLHVNGGVKVEGKLSIEEINVSRDLKVEGKLTLNGINGKVKVLSNDSAYGMIEVRNSNNKKSKEASIGFFPSKGAENKDAWVIGVGGWGHENKFVIGHRGEGANDKSPRLVIDSKGHVGIGTTTPSSKAKLVVIGTGNSLYGGRYGYIDHKGAGGPNDGGTRKYSIFCNDAIACSAVRASSDERIKTINGVSNSEKDLQVLSKIEITDYQHVDVIGKGAEPHKKVIAQQVKTVFPQSVSADIEDFIPNIYTKTEIKEGWIILAADVKINDRVKLIFSDGVKEVKVLEKLDGMFKVDTDKEGEVFVYGKEVSDFHTVDYDAISMLNVSATQELLKRLENLEQEVINLKNKEQ